jgi:hypothetical protein
MWGVSDKREPIKGEFAKKIIECVKRMVENKDKNATFKNKNHISKHNITVRQ